MVTNHDAFSTELIADLEGITVRAVVKAGEQSVIVVGFDDPEPRPAGINVHFVVGRVPGSVVQHGDQDAGPGQSVVKGIASFQFDEDPLVLREVHTKQVAAFMTRCEVNGRSEAHTVPLNGKIQHDFCARVQTNQLHACSCGQGWPYASSVPVA